jgi:hypothetical protein
MPPETRGQLITHRGNQETTFSLRIQRDGKRSMITLLKVPNAQASSRATRRRLDDLIARARSQEVHTPARRTRGQLIRYAGKSETTFRLRFLIDGERKSIVLMRVRNEDADTCTTQRLLRARIAAERAKWGTASLSELEDLAG